MSETNRLTWNLSYDDAVAVSSALNEICNGVDIEDWEFETRLGLAREELRRVHSELRAIVQAARLDEGDSS